MNGIHKDIGEVIEGMPDRFTVAPLSKWKDSPFYAISAQKAVESFQAAGAILPIHIDDDSVVVQEYYDIDTVTFVFIRQVAGEELFCAHSIKLDKGMAVDLEMRGLWVKPTEH